MRLTPMRGDTRRTAKGVAGTTAEPADKVDRALGSNPSGTGRLGRLLCHLACLGSHPRLRLASRTRPNPCRVRTRDLLTDKLLAPAEDLFQRLDGGHPILLVIAVDARDPVR